MDVSQTIFEEYTGDLGPEKIIHIYEPVAKLRAIVVVDNAAAGPAIGGVRMAPDITTTKIRRLARAMMLKTAAAGRPHGGGKAGIIADPRTGGEECLIRTFARAIESIHDYTPGPDMGTDESCMAAIFD